MNYKGCGKINILFPETFDISGVFVYQFCRSSNVHGVFKVTLWAIVVICPIDAVNKLNWAIVATVAVHDKNSPQSQQTPLPVSRCCPLQSSSSCPHWSAIASAIPWNVWLRSFQRSGLGGIFQMRCSRPSTMSVGVNRGKPFSHRHVRFVSPCPYCHG